MSLEDRKEYARLRKEIDKAQYKMSIIEAKHTKDVWTDPTFDKEKLRKAELTLRLDADIEYKMLLEQVWELEEKQEELDVGDLVFPEMDYSSIVSD